MAESLGRGTIELVADARAFRATMQEAKKSISDLGKGQSAASASSSRSIDAYIQKLQVQNATLGKSAREAKLYELAIRGASDAQIKAADAALRYREANERNLRSTRSFGLAQLGLSIGFIATAQSLARMSDEYTKYTAQLRLATTGEAEFAQAQEDVRRIAGAAQSDLGSTGVLYARIATSARELGLEQKTAADLTETVALSLKVSGATAAEAGSAILQLSQAFASGVLRGEEFNAVNEAAPRLLRALADGLQVPVGALREMAADGKLTADVLARELPKALGDLRKEAGSINTISGSVQLLKNRFLELVGASAESSGSVKGLVDVIQLLADNLHLLRVPLEAVLVFGGNVAYVFRTIGIAAAGVAEQLDGFRRGGVKGFQEARKIVSDILEQNRKDFDAWEQSILGGSKAIQQFVADTEDAAIGRSMQGGRSAAQRAAAEEGKKKTKRAPADNSAERLARAEMQAQLDAIRRGNDAQIAEYARAARLIEARRAADLIDEKQATELRRSLIDLNLQAQEKALQAEIAILQKRTFIGKDAAADQLENAGKILDLEARLARARAEAATDAEGIAIAERGRLKATARSLDEARASTDEYIASLQRRNALELAGVGQGAQARDQSAGLADIEARFSERRRELEAERRRGQIGEPTFQVYLAEATRAYRGEVELFSARTTEMLRLQSDWRNGAREALQNYIDDVRNVAKTFEDVFSNSIKRTEDALVSFLDTGKIDIKSFAASITSELNRAFVRERFTGPLAESIKGGKFLDGILGIFGTKGLGAQAPAPVVSRDIGSSIAGFADNGAFTASVAAAGTTFSTATIAAGTSLSATLAAAGASLAATIASAGASFAATVSAASVGGGGGGGGLGDLAALALDSFATGTPYVPQTGLYQLHKGEAVIPAGQNAGTNHFSVTVNAPPGMDRRTAAHMGVEVARSAQRELARGTA